MLFQMPRCVPLSSKIDQLSLLELIDLSLAITVHTVVQVIWDLLIEGDRNFHKRFCSIRWPHLSSLLSSPASSFSILLEC